MINLTLAETNELILEIATAIDNTLNEDKKNRVNGFVMITFAFNRPGCNYVANTKERNQIIPVLKEVIARLEKNE